MIYPTKRESGDAVYAAKTLRWSVKSLLTCPYKGNKSFILTAIFMTLFRLRPSSSLN